jgi:hypothetical protein
MRTMEDMPSNLTPQELNERQKEIFNLLPKLDVEDLKDLVTVVAVLSNEVETIKGPMFDRLGVGDPLTIQVPKNTEAIKTFMEMQHRHEDNQYAHANTPTPAQQSGFLSRLGLGDITDTVTTWDTLRRWWLPFLLMLVLGGGYVIHWWLHGGIQGAHERRLDMARLEAREDSVRHAHEMERLRLELAIEKAGIDTLAVSVGKMLVQIPDTLAVEPPTHELDY